MYYLYLFFNKRSLASSQYIMPLIVVCLFCLVVAVIGIVPDLIIFLKKSGLFTSDCDGPAGGPLIQGVDGSVYSSCVKSWSSKLWDTISPVTEFVSSVGSWLSGATNTTMDVIVSSAQCFGACINKVVTSNPDKVRAFLGLGVAPACILAYITRENLSGMATAKDFLDPFWFSRFYWTYMLNASGKYLALYDKNQELKNRMESTPRWYVLSHAAMLFLRILYDERLFLQINHIYCVNVYHIKLCSSRKMLDYLKQKLGATLGSFTIVYKQGESSRFNRNSSQPVLLRVDGSATQPWWFIPIELALAHQYCIHTVINMQDVLQPQGGLGLNEFFEFGHIFASTLSSQLADSLISINSVLDFFTVCALVSSLQDSIGNAVLINFPAIAYLGNTVLINYPITGFLEMLGFGPSQGIPNSQITQVLPLLDPEVAEIGINEDRFNAHVNVISTISGVMWALIVTACLSMHKA